MRSLISSALPEPTNKAASGARRLAVTLATGRSPADSASKANSSRVGSKDEPGPKSTPTSTTRGSLDGLGADEEGVKASEKARPEKRAKNCALAIRLRSRHQRGSSRHGLAPRS